MAETTSLPTIWEVPDELWNHIQALLTQYDPPCKTGRKRIDARLALNGIIYRARTGCQWNQLPKEFGDDASIHRTLQAQTPRSCHRGQSGSSRVKEFNHQPFTHVQVKPPIGMNVPIDQRR